MYSALKLLMYANKLLSDIDSQGVYHYRSLDPNLIIR